MTLFKSINGLQYHLQMLVLLVFIFGCMSHMFLLDPPRILPMRCTTNSLLNNLAPLHLVLHQAPRPN